MHLHSLKSAKLVPLFRERLASHVPGHATLDYAAMFATGRRRALQLWHDEIVPDLDLALQREFERALMSVGMRAGMAIPTVFANGYTYGQACNRFAGGSADSCQAAAATCGLYFFVLGLFDHLFDEYPQVFRDMGGLFGRESLKRWALDRDLEAMCCEGSVLAQGLVQLYRTYFRRCHRLLDQNPDPALAQLWYETLCEMHEGEARSVDRRISRAVPSLAVIDESAQLTESGYRGLAISACLGDGLHAAQQVLPFAIAFGRLSWWVDDVTDLDKDIDNDIWNALAARLMLEAGGEAAISKVIENVADEAAGVVRDVYARLQPVYWVAGDRFSLADYLWGSFWAWLGGASLQARNNYN